MAIDFTTLLASIQLGSPGNLNNIFAGGGSIMGWFDARTVGEGPFGRLFSKSSDNTTPDGWTSFLDGLTPGAINSINFAHNFSTTTGSWTTPASSISFNVWHHFAITYDNGAVGNNPSIYIDGILQTLVEQTTPVGVADDDSALPLAIGNTDNEIRAFDGLKDDYRLYSRIVGAAEVMTIFASEGADGIVDGLISRYDFREKAPGVNASTLVDSTEVEVSSGTSVVVPVPTGVQDGDLLTAYIVPAGDGSGTPGNVTDDSGNWTLDNTGDTDLPSTASTPSLWAYHKTASSEPANYTFSINQTTPILAVMKAFRGVNTTPDVVSALNTASSITPTSPSVTPSGDALVNRIAVTDDDEVPGAEADFYPPLVNQREALEDPGPPGNGASLGVADEDLRERASGTKDWNPVGAEQNAGLTMAFLGVDLPKDIGGGGNRLEPVGPLTYEASALASRRRRVR